MLKEFIAHIQKTTQPLVQQIDGSTFVISGNGDVEEIHPAIYHPDTLPLHSLEALVKMVQTEAANMAAPLYITVPNHLTVRCFGPLRPFRTFQEVEQPESEFLLRMDEEGNIGLFEADGGMWKLTARQTIKAFLEANLSDLVASGGAYIAL